MRTNKSATLLQCYHYHDHQLHSSKRLDNKAQSALKVVEECHLMFTHDASICFDFRCIVYGYFFWLLLFCATFMPL